MQKKLTSGALLNEKGHLNQAGYATKLVKSYDPKQIKAPKWRIKEWDYYLIYNKDYAVALTVADNRYMGMLSASFIDLLKPEEKTSSIITLFTNGKTNMPTTSKCGDVCASEKGTKFEFLNDGKKRILKCHYENFNGNDALEVEFLLGKEPKDSIVIATPFENKPKAFYYNQKIVGIPASGRVKYGEKEIVFDAKDTFAILDWGRGVWPYKNTWYWSSACGVVDGKKIGFNLGYGFGDTSAASENILFCGDYSHKLDQVVFNIPTNEKGQFEYEKQWTITSNDGRVEMVFDPIIDRKSCTDVLVLKSDQHQVFGKFSGTIILDDGTALKIKDFVGFAERVVNKW